MNDDENQSSTVVALRYLNSIFKLFFLIITYGHT